MGRICLPPATYTQEKDKIANRFPAAIDFIRRRKLNELFPGPIDEVGIICQGGLYNSVVRALSELGLADAFGAAQIPIFCLNVTYPLVPDEITQFCAGKRAVLMVEEGQSRLSRAGDQRAPAQGRPQHHHRRQVGAADGRRIHRRGDAARASAASSKARCRAASISSPSASGSPQLEGWKSEAQRLIGAAVPKRPPGFCTGCPERPVFSAIKLVERDLGKIHVAADIGCHTFSTLPPFNIGNSVLGYGLGPVERGGRRARVPEARHLASWAMAGSGITGSAPASAAPPSTIRTACCVIMNNGYSSATGQQYLPSTTAGGSRKATATIEQALGQHGHRLGALDPQLQRRHDGAEACARR